MPVVDCSVPSFSGLMAGVAAPAPECHSAKTAVPPLLKATIQNRNGLLLWEAKVAPVALVLMESAELIVTQMGSPFALVVSRNGIRTGSPALGSAPATVLTATVRRLDPTEADRLRLIGALNP